MRDLIPYLIGYGFAIVVGHFAIVELVDGLWRSIGDDEEHWTHRPGWWLPKFVGWIERALYVAAINLGAHEFVGVWLALKVAGKWYAWEKGIKESDRVLSANCIYSIFLIGNGVSLGYAIIGSYLISEIQKSVPTSIAVMLVILVATVWLRYIANKYGKKVEKDAT